MGRKQRKTRPAGPSKQPSGWDAGEPLLTSGVVSRLLGIPVWVLKQLDREDVVKPHHSRGKWRYYSQNDLTVLKEVWSYMDADGVNVAGVKVILRMQGR